MRYGKWIEKNMQSCKTCNRILIWSEKHKRYFCHKCDFPDYGKDVKTNSPEVRPGVDDDTERAGD